MENDKQPSSGRKNFILKQGRLSPKFDVLNMSKNRTMMAFATRNISHVVKNSKSNGHDNTAEWAKSASIRQPSYQ